MNVVNDHELAPPLPAFPVGDVRGKVWSTPITTQHAGIYPKSSLGFTTYRVSFPVTIYWCFELACTVRVSIYWRFAY